ncbi:MAG: hypothetical protein KDK54_21720 [Leptospiraceae bacterium]|nr:hypothetical protein [Leptospiraceae bacterium]
MVIFSTANVSPTSTIVSWKCSAPAKGILFFKKANSTLDWESHYSPYDSEIHAFTLEGLTSDLEYLYQVYCGTIGFATSFIQSFKTLPPNDFLSNINGTKGIWIFGGIGSSGNPISQVDVYDPINSVWHSSVTSIPSARAFSIIISHKSKIYVMGGMTKSSNGTWTAVSTVEEYNPSSNSWRTMNSMPVNLQGGVGISVENEIYLVGGTTTSDMTTGTILNTVLKFKPELGSTGTWSSYTSLTSIFARVDLSGCGIEGSLFLTGGRLYSDGNPYATSDAYIPSANATSSVNEASISSARHGAAYACYKPLPTDVYPDDPAGLLIAGGSTGSNISQPVTSISPANLFDYYKTGSSTNSIQAGPVIPVSLYYSSMEISYEKRKAYLFGGASAINLPQDTVYSIGLENPVGGPWEELNVKMPVARFAHKAVIINR